MGGEKNDGDQKLHTSTLPVITRSAVYKWRGRNYTVHQITGWESDELSVAYGCVRRRGDVAGEAGRRTHGSRRRAEEVVDPMTDD